MSPTATPEATSTATVAVPPATGPSPTARAAVRVLVVDSHPMMRWALTQIAATHDDLQVVAEAATPDEALAIAYSVLPDVVTVECTRADESGLALVVRLREAYPEVGIVVLTADPSDGMLFRALNCGASAYVPKAAPIPDVLAAIRHAAVAPRSFSAAGLADALRRKREVSERISLSPREHQILVLLHEGMSVPAVAAQLYVSLSTAKTYVAKLYEKLGARNRAQALMTAVRLGLLEHELHTAV